MYVPALSAGSVIPYNTINATNRFVSLGCPRGNKGLLRVAYLSKVYGCEDLVLDAPTYVSGYCSYAFLATKSKYTVGFLVQSPVGITQVSPYVLSIGRRSEEFKVRNDLLPQGVSMFESVEGYVLFASSSVASSLLIVVD